MCSKPLYESGLSWPPSCGPCFEPASVLQYDRVLGDQNGLCRQPPQFSSNGLCQRQNTSLDEDVEDCDAMFVCLWTITTITQRTPSQYVDNFHEWYAVWISCEGPCAINLSSDVGLKLGEETNTETFSNMSWRSFVTTSRKVNRIPRDYFTAQTDRIPFICGHDPLSTSK